MWQLRMHCNLRQPDVAQSLSALSSPHMSSLKSLSLSVAVLQRFTANTLRYAATLNFDPSTLTFNLWPWTCVVGRLRHDQSLYEIWAKSNNPRQCYCDLNIWPKYRNIWPKYLTLNMYHVCCRIVCTKFKLTQAIRSWNVTIFFMLIRHVTLWSWPLTRWAWKFVVDLVSRGHSL